MNCMRLGIDIYMPCCESAYLDYQCRTFSLRKGLVGSHLTIKFNNGHYILIDIFKIYRHIFVCRFTSSS